MSRPITFREFKDLSLVARIKVERTKTAPDYDKGSGLYYFELRASIEIDRASTLKPEDILYVTYTLDDTFGEYAVQTSQDRERNFQLTFWTYGFFEIKAEAFTSFKKSFKLPSHKITFDVTDEHRKANGAEEFTWD